MSKRTKADEPPEIKVTEAELRRAADRAASARTQPHVEALTVMQQIVAHLDTQLAGTVEELNKHRERLVCVEAAQALSRRSLSDPIAALEEVERLLDQIEQLGELAKAHAKQSRELSGLCSSIHFSVETLHADVMRRGREEKKRQAMREAGAQQSMFEGQGEPR